MLRFVLFALPVVVATSVSGEQKDLTWKALEGDRLNLNGRIMNVHGVVCPSPEQAAGLEAKRLANTYLRGGVVACVTSLSRDGTQTVDCAKRDNNGLLLSQMLIFTELCVAKTDEECLVPRFDALPTYELPPKQRDV
jgi:hypothetical protein